MNGAVQTTVDGGVESASSSDQMEDIMTDISSEACTDVEDSEELVQRWPRRSVTL